MPTFDDFVRAEEDEQARTARIRRESAAKHAKFVAGWWVEFVRDFASMLPYLEGRFDTETICEDEFHFTVEPSGEIVETRGWNGTTSRSEIGTMSVARLARGDRVRAWRFPHGFLLDSFGDVWLESQATLSAGLVRRREGMQTQLDGVTAQVRTAIRLDRSGLLRFFLAQEGVEIMPVVQVDGRRLPSAGAHTVGERNVHLTAVQPSPKFYRNGYHLVLNDRDPGKAEDVIGFCFGGSEDRETVQSVMFNALKRALSAPDATRLISAP